MAGECSASSVIAATSPTPVNWWDLHTSSLSSWNSGTNTWHQPNPNSSSSCDKDVSRSPSFTNASNHSSLTVESSRRLVEPAVSSSEFVGEHASDNHMWNHVLFNGNLQSSQDNGQNFLDALSSKSMSNGIFDVPACNYLKKIDNSWDYNNSSTSFNNFDKQLLGGCSETMVESERLTRLSNLVSNWSITPSYPEVKSQFEPQANNISLSFSVNHGGQSDRQAASIFPFYDHDVKEENDNHSGVHEASSGRSCNGSYGYQIGVNSPMIGENGKYCYGVSNITPCTSIRNFPDMAINTQLRKQFIESHAPKPSFKPLNLSECRKQDIQTSALSMKGNGGRRQQTTTTEAKKKRSDDSTETALKKPKHESSTSSSTKAQAPKVKLGDRITTLQQIVSPFGKTDTASVLYEAIGYIKFLQEQVQLLSDPYLKTNSHKDTWGSVDRKNKADVNNDLRSRGLCLIPISCTPQAYRENTGPDYWTPAYRGCLYR